MFSTDKDLKIILLELKELVGKIIATQESLKDSFAVLEVGLGTANKQVKELVLVRDEHKKIFSEHKKMSIKLEEIQAQLEDLK